MYQQQFGRIGLGATPATQGGDPGGGFAPRSMQIGTGAPPPSLGMAPPSPAPYPGAPVPSQSWNQPQQWGSRNSGSEWQGQWQNPGNDWNPMAGPMPGMMPSGRSPADDMQRRAMGAPGSPQGMKTAMGGTNGFRGTLSGGVRA